MNKKLCFFEESDFREIKSGASILAFNDSMIAWTIFYVSAGIFKFLKSD
jgi:hypothetical protein